MPRLRSQTAQHHYRLSTVSGASRNEGGNEYRQDRDDDRRGNDGAYQPNAQRFGTGSPSGSRGGLAPGNRGEPPPQRRAVTYEREQAEQQSRGRDSGSREDRYEDRREEPRRRDAGPSSSSNSETTESSTTNSSSSSNTSSSVGGSYPEHISSTSNAYVKHCAALRTSSKARATSRTFLLVGAELIWEAVGHPHDCPIMRASRFPVRAGLQGGQRCADVSLSVFVARATRATPQQRRPVPDPYAHPPGILRNLLQRRLLQGARPPVLPPNLKPSRRLTVTDSVMKKVTGLDSVAAVAAVVELDLPGRACFTDWISDPIPDLNSTSSGHTSSVLTAVISLSDSADLAELPATVVGGERERGERRVLERLLVLDGIQDPGNLGTLVRSALAFGWDGVWLLPGCCDPFNDKAVRASRGAVLRLPMDMGSVQELAELSTAAGLDILAADMGDEEEEEGLGVGGSGGSGSSGDNGTGSAGSRGSEGGGGGRKGRGVALVLGSEGQGLSPEVRNLHPTLLSVPMAHDKMESLNVGVAGGVLMFALSGVANKLQRQLAAIQGRA
ncbi:MAG: hypothetical protein WDW38_003861 [Sanguina aurantia]